MKRLALTVLAVLAIGDVRAAEPLGRLFFTPEQRNQLDVARAQRSRATLTAEIEEQAPAPEVVTYHGLVRRSDGKNTVWMNNRTINDGQTTGRLPPPRPRSDGSIVLELPQSERKIKLKVGQSVELLSGTIAEPYARSSITSTRAKTPVQEGSQKPAVPESSGAKPAVPQAVATNTPPDKPPTAAPLIPIRPGVNHAEVEAQLEATLEQMRRGRTRASQDGASTKPDAASPGRSESPR